LRKQALYHALCLAKIASPEQVVMIQDVVKVIQILSLLMACLQRPSLIVSRIEVITKAPEPMSHCDVCFSISEIGRRINDRRCTIGKCTPVATP